MFLTLMTSVYYLWKDELIIFCLLFIIVEKDKRIDLFVYEVRIKFIISCLTWLTLIELAPV